MTTVAGFAEARGDLAQALIPHAAGLAVAVREETRPEIRARLVGLSRTELEGLAVVLAAMVDPGTSLYEALAWVNFDEYGGPAAPYDKRSKTTIRDKAGSVRQTTCRVVGVDKVAVYRALAGDPVELNRNERALAVDIGIRSGMGYDDLAELLGIDRESVQRAWERRKQEARAEGRPVPLEPVGRIGAAARPPRKIIARVLIYW